MPNPSTNTIRESAQPLVAFLRAHYPALSEEARTAFAIQIAIAHHRADEEHPEVLHLFGGRSPN